MSDVAGFLAARIGEDEAVAKAVQHLAWTGGEGHIGLSTSASMHIARHDPARVLREAGAKRYLLRYHGSDVGFPGDPGSLRPNMIMRHLAAVWCDHPDYDESWRPGG